jgi:hypothetical protein
MPTDGTQQPQSAWTVLVYLAGDNNLTQEMSWGLQELKKAAGELNPAGRPAVDRINVVAHFDPRGARGRRYDFVPPGAAGVPHQEDGNLDRYETVVYTDAMLARAPASADQPAPEELSHRSSQLEKFVSEQVRRLPPAKQYFLVLSGHGSGAVGDFLIDSDPATSLSIPELARILDLGRQAYQTQWREKPRIGVLGMDSCLMSTAEVCFEVREHALFLVASEGFVSSAGWPYHRVLEAIANPKAKEPDPGPRAVALRVARHYSDFYRDYEISGLSTDVAVCDLGAFRKEGPQSLVGLLRAFSSQCIPRLEAVYVREVLARTDVKDEEAQAAIKTLSDDVARTLIPEGDSGREALATRLREGSDAAQEALRVTPWEREQDASQLDALRELLDSLEGRYHVEGKPGECLEEHAKRLQEEIKEPSSLPNALAVVKVLREFDPGVRDALERIEHMDQEGNPEAARRARVRLQKLHQVRSLLELKQRAGATLKREDRLQHALAAAGLRDALVAARWQAQSFKAGVYVDLFDLCRCLEGRLPDKDPVANLAGHLRRAVEKSDGGPEGAVLLSRYTGPDFQHAHGLSVYFPFQAGDYKSEYENLAFAQVTGWGRLMRAYLRVTRRGRRDESEHWAKPEASVLRFDQLEVDPLEAGTIEARIVGVAGPPRKEDRFLARKVRAGTEARIRALAEAAKARAGTEQRIRAGTEQRIRAGTEQRIRGEAVQAVWGNPPDGFFRQP